MVIDLVVLVAKLAVVLVGAVVMLYLAVLAELALHGGDPHPLPRGQMSPPNAPPVPTSTSRPKPPPR